MPPYDVRIDEARGLVLVEAIGAIDAPIAVQMVTAAREASSLAGLPILYDMRRSNPGDMSSGALFWMPRELPSLKNTVARRTRVALLHEPRFAAMARYWEDAFRNAGLAVAAFTDEDDAVAWLRGEGVPGAAT